MRTLNQEYLTILNVYSLQAILWGIWLQRGMAYYTYIALHYGSVMAMINTNRLKTEVEQDF